VDPPLASGPAVWLLLAPYELNIWPCAMNLWLCNHCRLTQPNEVEPRPGRESSPNVIHVHRAADGIDTASAVMDADSARRGAPCRILLGRNPFSSPREVRLAIVGFFRIPRFGKVLHYEGRAGGFHQHLARRETLRSTRAFSAFVMLSRQNHRPIVRRDPSISCPCTCTHGTSTDLLDSFGRGSRDQFGLLSGQLLGRFINGKDEADIPVPGNSKLCQLAVSPTNPQWQSTA